MDEMDRAAAVVARVENAGRIIRFVAGERRGLPWPIADDMLRTSLIDGGFAVLPEAVTRRTLGLTWLAPATRLLRIDGTLKIAVGPGLAVIAADRAGIDLTTWLRLHTDALVQVIERQKAGAP